MDQSPAAPTDPRVEHNAFISVCKSVCDWVYDRQIKKALRVLKLSSASQMTCI